MRKDIELKKLGSLPTANDMLDEKYGKLGSVTRDAFEAKAKAWYYAEVLKDARKSAGITGEVA